MKTFHRAALVLAAVACALLGAGAAGADQLAVKFSLDWKFEGPSAAYLLADDKGYYEEEGWTSPSTPARARWRRSRASPAVSTSSASPTSTR